MEILAFYFPGLYVIPENEAWWGEGFSEWTHLRQATALYPGHRPPQGPSELGFYDPRDDDVRVAQAALASSFGLTGFIYWHYWFEGRQPFHETVDRIMSSGAPTFGFCTAWANGSWTRAWSGSAEVLLKQTYPGAEDDRAHFEYLRPMFTDERHVRLDGRPVFFVWAPHDLPDAGAFVERWRSMAEEIGGIYLVAIVTTWKQGEVYRAADRDGFDAAVTFKFPRARRSVRDRLYAKTLARWLGKRPTRYVYDEQPPIIEGDIGIPVLPQVMPNWDNTPRRGRNGVVLTRTSPRHFERQVRTAAQRAQRLAPGHQALVVTSWNEWGEGSHLEPDERNGRAWLEALAVGLQGGDAP